MGKAISAGLLAFRRLNGLLEVLLAHPGGPVWANRDLGAWTVPKGSVEQGEEDLDTAIREFREETGFEPRGPYLYLGEVTQKAGKIVRCWAWEGDLDASNVVSNLVKVVWPPGSGRWLTIPEIDRCAWLAPDAARAKINPAQVAFIDRLEAILKPDSGSQRGV